MSRRAVAGTLLFTSIGFLPLVHAEVIDDATLIKNVTVISPERDALLAHAVVAIHGGKIAAIGTDLVSGARSTVIDGRGGFLIPGLIDSHVHVGNQGPLDDDALDKHPELLQAYRAQLPRSYLAFGFTTLVDLDLRDKTLDWFNATPLHPDLCSCGRGVHIAGGYGAQRVPKDAADADASNIVYEPDQAKDWPSSLDPNNYTPAHAVDRAKKAGAVCLKVFYEPGFGGAANWPVFSPQTLATLRAEATRQGLVMVVHANAVESWRAALSAHADVIAHGLWHWGHYTLDVTPPPEARKVINAAAAAHIGVQPTLQVVYGDLSIFDKSLLNDPRFGQALPRSVVEYLEGHEGRRAQSAQTDEYRHAIAALLGKDIDPAEAMTVAAKRATATLRMMLAAKVKLLFGTDTPSNEGIGNPPGLNGRLEMNHWVDAGVSLRTILRAATIDNASAFGMSDRGTIEVGKRADFLLLRENPLKTIAAYDSLDTIFLNGEPLSRASLLAR